MFLVGRTYSESQAEGDVADGVDASVDGGVADVDEVTQLRHHRAVDHADGETQTSIGDDQVVDVACQGNLNTRFTFTVAIQGDFGERFYS